MQKRFWQLVLVIVGLGMSLTVFGPAHAAPATPPAPAVGETQNPMLMPLPATSNLPASPRDPRSHCNKSPGVSSIIVSFYLTTIPASDRRLADGRPLPSLRGYSTLTNR